MPTTTAPTPPLDDDSMIHTEWSRVAKEEYRQGNWTEDDWYTFCERAGRISDLKTQSRADFDAWYDTAADVAERKKEES